jgi:hypothetical protein
VRMAPSFGARAVSGHNTRSLVLATFLIHEVGHVMHHLATMVVRSNLMPYQQSSRTIRAQTQPAA